MSSPRRALAIIVALLLAVTPTLAQPSEYGSTQFPNSGDEAAQEPFLQGLLMLHSFEYDDARHAFQRAQEIDPDFAMAHWGEAMTHNHPVWMEQDRNAALDALRDLGNTRQNRLENAPTEREKAYLRTVHVLFGAGRDDPMSKQMRDDAYADAMSDLAETYPEDLDAQAFHALSILGTAHEGRNFATYMRAAAIVEEVFDENPQHPGAAHYLIHAYDDPVHAPLGLRPARIYDDIAPAATHALHMPSHIFFALGMWDRGAESNVQSFEAARTKSNQDERGLSGGGFHALHWLHYARLQQGRYDDARSVLSTTRRHATDPDVSTGYASYMQWYMPVAYVIETQRWDQLPVLLDTMNVDVDGLDSRGSVTVRVAQGLAAARQGNLSQAKEALSQAQSTLEESADEELRIQVNGLEGLLALKEGNSDRATDVLAEAVTLEEERPLDYGPPFPPKPIHELYGQVLLALDRPSDALSAFNAALDRYPDRSLSLWGKARAASRTGATDVARAAQSKLSTQWSGADRTVRERLQALVNSSETEEAGSR